MFPRVKSRVYSRGSQHCLPKSPGKSWKAAEKEEGGWAAGEKGGAHTRKQKHRLRVGLEVGKVQPSLGHLPDDILSPTLLKIQLSAPCTTLLNLSEEDRHTKCGPGD